MNRESEGAASIVVTDVLCPIQIWQLCISRVGRLAKCKVVGKLAVVSNAHLSNSNAQFASRPSRQRLCIWRDGELCMYIWITWLNIVCSIFPNAKLFASRPTYLKRINMFILSSVHLGCFPAFLIYIIACAVYINSASLKSMSAFTIQFLY